MKKTATQPQLSSPAGAPADAARPARSTAFTFGDPLPVMNRADILDYAELVTVNGWYEPPV